MINQILSQQLIYFENRLTEDFLCEITNKNPTNENLTKDELKLFNLIRRDEFNVGILAHKFLIQKIIEFGFKKFFPNSPIQKLTLDYLNFTPREDIDLSFLDDESKNSFIKILEFLHTEFLNSEYSYQNGTLNRIKSKINLKDTGSVYTREKVAEEIVLQTIQNRVSQGTEAENLKILDFGCGTGRFYIVAFKILHENFGVSKNQIVDNLHALDLDKIALTILKLKVLFETGIENLDTVNQNILHRNMLVLNNRLSFGENVFFDYQNDFFDVVQSDGFDVIVSNPPYLLLKINKNRTENAVFAKYFQCLSEKTNQELQIFSQFGNL